MSTLKVGTIQDHANSNTAISIDSSGRVLLPQRVAFMGKKTDTNQLDNSTNAIAFNHTDLAHASWDGTTFTAPITGLYRLFVNGHRQTTGTNPMELGILVNNSTIETGYALGASGGRPRVSAETLTVLTAGQTVTFKVTQGDVFAGNNPQSSGVMCSGYLIG